MPSYHRFYRYWLGRRLKGLRSWMGGLWSWTALQEAKSRAADGDPALLPAIDALRSDVDNALAFEPVSVMSKEPTPP